MHRLLKHSDKFALIVVNIVVVILLDQLMGWIGYGDLTASFRSPHPVYHHDLRPSVSALTRWGNHRYRISTNSLGFRDCATRDVALETHRRRILLIGDSFTEGLGVSCRASFAGRLARAANDDTEVLNAGVMGYSPTLYLLKTQNLLNSVGLEIDELVVFIDMSDLANEIIYADWVPGDPDAAIPPPPGFRERFRGRSMLRRSIALWYSREESKIRWNLHGMPFADDLNAAAFQDPAFYSGGGYWDMADSYVERATQYALDQMERLAQLCARKDIALTLVIYPWPNNILRRELDHPQVDLWRGFAEQRGLRLVNLFPDFILNGMDPEQTVERFFVEGDVHWNSEGHALVARRIHALLNPQLD